MNTKVLIIADHSEDALNESTARALACASQLSPESLEVAVFSDDGAALARQAAQIDGVTRALHVDSTDNAYPLAAMLAPQIASLVASQAYSHVLAPNTTFGKDLMPRVAAELGVCMVTDLMKVNGPHEFERPIYAGNAITTVKAPADQMLAATVRCASYAPAPQGNDAVVESITLDVELPNHTRLSSLERQQGDRPDLQSAGKVVSGGRGVGSPENFEKIYTLADKIGAAVGASRAAVDAGYVPNDMQVGQTGKVISPKLYICFGISGAIQHIAGIKDAETIVAINNDEDAPIFDFADIGLVGDLFEIIPDLQQQLS